MTEENKTKPSDEELRQLWRDFGDTPIDDDDLIEESFLHFEPGTDRFDVWHWFDDNYSKGVKVLMIDVGIEDIIFEESGFGDSQQRTEVDSNGDSHLINDDDVIEYILAGSGDIEKDIKNKEKLAEYLHSLNSKEARADYWNDAIKNMLENNLNNNESSFGSSPA